MNIVLLIILDPPMFIQVPKSQIAWTAWVPGELNFIVSGDPQPDIRVYKDLRLVSPGTIRLRLQISPAGGCDSHLTIRVEQVLQYDEGVYTVKLSNKGGITKYSVSIHVEGKVYLEITTILNV